MKYYSRCTVAIFGQASLVLLLVIAAAVGPANGSRHQASNSNINFGYSALKLFLADEQHLTTIRRVKTVISLEGVSKATKKLIDDIADSSEQALAQLEKLAPAKPAIVFHDFDDDFIGKATLDSMRYATAKEFLFDSDDFEKNLLVSQAQILRVISHLASQLEQNETNPKRRAWLNKLSRRYEAYYQRVFARISVNT